MTRLDRIAQVEAILLDAVIDPEAPYLVGIARRWVTGRELAGKLARQIVSTLDSEEVRP